MKKIFLFILLSLPLISFAQQLPNPLHATTVEGVMRDIVRLFTWLAIAIAPIAILVGAFFILTSEGEPQKVERGKTILTYAVIALFIVLFASGLISLVQRILRSS